MESDKRRKATTINYKDMNRHGFNKPDTSNEKIKTYNQISADTNGDELPVKLAMDGCNDEAPAQTNIETT